MYCNYVATPPQCATLSPISLPHHLVKVQLLLYSTINLFDAAEKGDYSILASEAREAGENTFENTTKWSRGTTSGPRLSGTNIQITLYTYTAYGTWIGARCSVVGWSQKMMGSIRHEANGFLDSPNISGRTIALVSTHTLKGNRTELNHEKHPSGGGVPWIRFTPGASQMQVRILRLLNPDRHNFRELHSEKRY